MSWLYFKIIKMLKKKLCGKNRSLDVSDFWLHEDPALPEAGNLSH